MNLPLYFRSNFIGTTFEIFDAGENPFKGSASTKNDENENKKPLREELGVILYVNTC
jgi:hypothetical protein